MAGCGLQLQSQVAVGRENKLHIIRAAAWLQKWKRVFAAMFLGVLYCRVMGYYQCYYDTLQEHGMITAHKKQEKRGVMGQCRLLCCVVVVRVSVQQKSGPSPPLCDHHAEFLKHMRASTAGKVHYRREVRPGLYPPLLLPLELVLLPLLVVKLRKETSQPRS